MTYLVFGMVLIAILGLHRPEIFRSLSKLSKEKGNLFAIAIFVACSLAAPIAFLGLLVSTAAAYALDERPDKPPYLEIWNNRMETALKAIGFNKDTKKEDEKEKKDEE